MSVKSNLIILDASKGISSKLREYFQGKGVATYIITKLTEAQSLLRELACPILLVELPDDSKKEKPLIEELREFAPAHQFPLFLVGARATELEEELTPTYALVTGIRRPVSNAELFEAITYTAQVFEFPESDAAPEKRSPPSSSGRFDGPPKGRPSSDRHETTVITTEQGAKDLYQGFNSIPNLFFAEQGALTLLQHNYYGKEYTLARDESSIPDKRYLPRESNVLHAVEETIKKLPGWAQSRIHRTSFVTHTILNNLDVDEKIVEKARIASLLCNWAIAKEQKNLLRKDYLSSRSKIVRKDLCSRIKDSAMKIAVELELPEVGNLVAKVGRIIGREEGVDSDPTSLAASAIASADMIDRACWYSDHFNPRSAYRIMYQAKAGELSEIHPAVLCSLIKMLAEAIASTTQVLLIPKKQRNDPALIQEAARIRNLQPGEGEEKVEIDKLTPGMRLSQPLVAFDGREILEEDLILDQDLIWRIWQLSLVRPLNAPLVIARNGKRKKPIEGEGIHDAPQKT